MPALSSPANFYTSSFLRPRREDNRDENSWSLWLGAFGTSDCEKPGKPWQLCECLLEVAARILHELGADMRGNWEGSHSNGCLLSN
jgi:hypothetical protein